MFITDTILVVDGKTFLMKKLLGIVVLGLLLSGNAYADENALLYFNQYLKNNGYNEYIEEVDICKELKKNSKEWFRPNVSIIQMVEKF